LTGLHHRMGRGISDVDDESDVNMREVEEELGIPVQSGGESGGQETAINLKDVLWVTSV